MAQTGTQVVERESTYTSQAVGPSSVEVRPLRTADIPEVGMLVREIVLGTEVWSEEFDYPRIANALTYIAVSPAKNPMQVYVAVLDGEIVGAMGMSVAPFWYGSAKAAKDEGLFVKKGFRGKGIGGELLKVFVEWAKFMGCKEAILAQSTGKAEMKAVKGAYRGAGFEIIGVVAKRKL